MQTAAEIIDFDSSKRGAFQGDLVIFRLSEAEAQQLNGRVIKHSESGDIRLLEGEMTGHHHTILSRTMNPQPVMFRDDALAAQLMSTDRISSGLAGNRGEGFVDGAAGFLGSRGTAVLFDDRDLALSLTWLRRSDLTIGFLRVEDGPVLLSHPEHDAIRLPAGTYYVGRQVESAGAEERVVAD